MAVVRVPVSLAEHIPRYPVERRQDPPTDDTPTTQTFNIMPGPTDRALFVGRTGSGKTTLATHLLQKANRYFRVFILDSKGEQALEIPGNIIVTRLGDIKQFYQYKPRVLIYRPDGQDAYDPEVLDASLQWAYECGGLLTYIDEVGALQQHMRPLPGLLNLLTRGRKRFRNGRAVYSPMWGATQRPRHIPLACYTESQHIYCFALNHLEDRRAVSQFTDSSFQEQPVEKYGFRWYTVHDGTSHHFGPIAL